MKKKKRGKSGPKFKLDEAVRGSWNIEGRQKLWLEKQSAAYGISESEMIRTTLNNIIMLAILNKDKDWAC